MSHSGRPGLSTRQAVIARDGNRCAYCGKPAGTLRADGKGKERMTLDHVVPRSKGGRSHPDNLVPCCHGCNQAKGALDLAKWKPNGWLRPAARDALLRAVATK